MNYMEIYNQWLESDYFDADTKKELENIKGNEKEIEETEAKIEEMDVLLCKEEVYSNPERSKEVSQEKSNLEDRLAELYELWEELM